MCVRVHVRACACISQRCHSRKLGACHVFIWSKLFRMTELIEKPRSFSAASWELEIKWIKQALLTFSTASQGCCGNFSIYINHIISVGEF